MTSQQFSNEIGIAPSSLHHIVSGRNNPSLEVIQKILDRFLYLNAEWLINGKGTPFKDLVQGELFDIPENKNENRSEIKGSADVHKQEIKKVSEVSALIKSSKKNIDRIVVFYSDNTFTVYDKGE